MEENNTMQGMEETTTEEMKNETTTEETINDTPVEKVAAEDVIVEEAPKAYDSSAGQSQNTASNGASAGNQPGKGAATASLVLGIISIVFWFFGMGALVGLITGIIGLVLSSNAKKQGFVGGTQTAGFVCSLIGLIGSALVFVACVGCAGVIGAAGLLGSM